MYGILQIAYNISFLFYPSWGIFSLLFDQWSVLVQVFLKATSVFSGDDKSPIVVGFWHFVSLLVMEDSYTHDQLCQSVGTLSWPVFDLKGPER